MKIKNVKLSWKVLNHDFNKDKIINYDIFWKSSSKEIAERIKNRKLFDYDTFKDSMKMYFMNYYWCRAECEIMVSGLHTKVNPVKIDIWRQIEMNLDRILEYIIREMDIDFNKLKKGDK